LEYLLVQRQKAVLLFLKIQVEQDSQWISRNGTQNKCELFLNKGDVVQIEVEREYGKIDLMISGKNGSEPYAGNSLESGLFTVKVSETDKYNFQISGKDASGKVIVKLVESITD